MGNLSRKAALGIAAVLTAATAATAVASVAGATPATTMAPASHSASVALATPVAPARMRAPAHLWWPRVQYGDRSVKVVNIQCLLRQRLGVWLPCNTRFTRETERDVRLFQWRHGLSPSGKVGPQAWPRLIITVGYGSRYHLAVLAAQASLRMAYRYPITIDGVFGPKTLAAVKSFQKSYGLRPDGIVGPLTWSTIVHFEW